MKKTILLVLITSLVMMFAMSTALANDENNDYNFDGESLYQFDDEVLSWYDVSFMYDAWISYINSHPNSDEQEQEQYLHYFVESGELRAAEASAVSVNGSYLPVLNSLNAEERALAQAHPVQAVKVFNCATKATNETINRYGHNGYQDNSDAFRHCCWNALMKYAMSISDAAAWANAHESESSGNDKGMDLHNNSVGRMVYAPSGTDSEIISKALDYVIDGTCWRIVNGYFVETDATGLI